MTKTEALKLRAIIESAMEGVNDQTASEAASLFPRMKGDGSLITAGTRINWNGVVKKAAVDLWDMAENNPDISPALWADINYRDGVRIIPEVITTALAFSEGEFGWWGDVKYASLVNANVYTPAQYPANWQEIA